MSELLPFLYPAVSGLLAGLAMYVLARAGWRKLALVLVLGLATAAALTLLRARGAEGMAGLGLIVMALMFLWPAALGGGLGALIGHWRRHKAGAGTDG